MSQPDHRERAAGLLAKAPASSLEELLCQTYQAGFPLIKLFTVRLFGQNLWQCSLWYEDTKFQYEVGQSPTEALVGALGKVAAGLVNGPWDFPGGPGGAGPYQGSSAGLVVKTEKSLDELGL